MQRQINLIGVLKGIEYVDAAIIDKCENMKEAILVCIQMRKVKYTQNEIAAYLDIDRGHYSRILNKDAHFPVNKITPLMELCGNYAPLQFLLKENGFQSDVIELLKKLAA